MSDLGLGNLEDLKRGFIPEAMHGETMFDNLLSEIGLGVAAAMEKFCNRLWKRTANDTFEVGADCTRIILPRYPVETVASIHQRDTITAGWVALTLNDTVVNRDDASGILILGTILGSYQSTLKVTYTGGYWYDTAEDYGTAQPSGSLLVPKDIKHAWITQCAHEFRQRDNASIAPAAAPLTNRYGAAVGIELLDYVKEMLRGRVRYA